MGPLACVFFPSSAFLEPEATTQATLSEVLQLPLLVPLPWVEEGWMEKLVRPSMALFLSLGLTTLSRDHLGWNATTAPLSTAK